MLQENIGLLFGCYFLLYVILFIKIYFFLYLYLNNLVTIACIFKIKATDNGEPPKSHTCRVSVAVISTPKTSVHPPVIKAAQSTEVTERDEVGFLVALIQATDADNDTLWYDIVGKCISLFSYLLS